MQAHDTRRRPRKLLLLLALAVAITTALAAAPSGQAGIIIPTNDADLNITLAGTGSGQVTYPNNSNTTVTCQPTCTTNYSWLIFVTPDTPELTAIAAAGSTFAGWTVTPGIAVESGCGVAITCEVNMGANSLNPIAVTATFTLAPNTFPLAVLKAGPGQGTVTSNVAGINCGPTCAANYNANTVVTLTAAPSAGSTFGGWSGGGCTGTGTCIVTMNAAQTVTATFNTQTFPLTTTVTGSGGVSSSPEGILCPATCTFQFASGTSVVLTGTPAPGFAFQGWSGAGCTGTGTCTVSMTQAQNVSATFVSAAVQASIVGNRIRKVGPRFAVRQLQVTVNAEEDLARIVIRVRRGGTTIQSRTIRNFAADTEQLRMNLRNGIASGRAQLQVTFVNEAGTQKVQTRGIRIPAV
jgi:hypothetical protein